MISKKQLIKIINGYINGDLSEFEMIEIIKTLEESAFDEDEVREDERTKVLDDFKEKLIETMPIDICDGYEAMEHIEKVYAQLKG